MLPTFIVYSFPNGHAVNRSMWFHPMTIAAFLSMLAPTSFAARRGTFLWPVVQYTDQRTTALSDSLVMMVAVISLNPKYGSVPLTSVSATRLSNGGLQRMSRWIVQGKPLAPTAARIFGTVRQVLSI
jgi:hypothetical protein